MRLTVLTRFVVFLVLFAWILRAQAYAQQPPEAPQSHPSGMSTGSAHAPIKDALSRPITAGGFVDGAPAIFVDITHSAGLEKFHHRMGGVDKKTILETPGSGVALLDYD